MAVAQSIYELRVIGGNSSINNTRVVQDENGNLVVQTGIRETPSRVLYPSGNGSLSVQTPKDKTKPEERLYLTLQGPSGKGEYQLRASSLSGGDGFAIGSQTLSGHWETIEEGPELLLRYNDLTRSSHWIAVHGGEGDENSTWSLWWYSPSAANMEDFEHYVAIDVHLVPVENGADDTDGKRELREES